jgi:hypothetical protein
MLQNGCGATSLPQARPPIKAAEEISCPQFKIVVTSGDPVVDRPTTGTSQVPAPSRAVGVGASAVATVAGLAELIELTWRQSPRPGGITIGAHSLVGAGEHP